MEARSLPDLFKQSVEQYDDNIMLWEKRKEHYKGLTYRDVHDRVQRFAAGLLQKGIQKGDRLALISEGRNDWVICELALLSLGAVCVPLSVKIEEDVDLSFRLQHSGCKGIVISANHQRKAFRLLDKLPGLELLVLLDGKNIQLVSDVSEWENIRFPEENIIGLDQLLEQGSLLLEKEPDCITKISVMPEDPANICYTSGTTADPKGIVLSHKNYIHNILQASEIFDVPEYYTSLHILPWDHSFAHTVGIYTLIRNGASMASLKIGKTPNETLRNIPICIQEVRPYFLLSVPALAKNFRKNIEKAIAKKGKLASWLFEKGLAIAYSYNQLGYNRGKGWRILLKPIYGLFDSILFSKIRNNFGGRLKFFVGGGALLDLELQKFFYAIGMPMYQGYGLTEAAPIISSNTPNSHKLGSSGRVVPYLELKIADESGQELPQGQKGEIVVKGDNVMLGYWENPKATEDALKDGWLHTGDIGYMDPDGFLYVLGRTKSLLIANDGEKYSPEGIEETVVEKSAFIDQIMLYNNQNPYTVALLYPNKSNIKQWALHNRHDPQTQQGRKAMLLKIQSEINKFMPHGELSNLFSPRWLPSTVYIMKEPFSENNGMVNSTLKIVRPAIIKHYKNALRFLYTPDAKEISNKTNLDNLAALLAEKDY